MTRTCPRRSRLLAVLCVASAACPVGCSRENTSAATQVPGSVFFKITSAPVTSTEAGDIRCWLATYDTGGKTARFRVEIAFEKSRRDMPIAFAEGAFYREEHSEPDVFLRHIARALGAPEVVLSAEKVDKLPFTAVILGTELSRGRGEDILAGSFTSDPKGDWIATKVFLGDGEAEVYVNLNPRRGKGEIAIKDPEYGGMVVTELSKVL